MCAPLPALRVSRPATTLRTLPPTLVLFYDGLGRILPPRFAGHAAGTRVITPSALPGKLWKLGLASWGGTIVKGF